MNICVRCDFFFLHLCWCLILCECVRLFFHHSVLFARRTPLSILQLWIVCVHSFNRIECLSFISLLIFIFIPFPFHSFAGFSCRCSRYYKRRPNPNNRRVFLLYIFSCSIACRLDTPWAPLAAINRWVFVSCDGKKKCWQLSQVFPVEMIVCARPLKTFVHIYLTLCFPCFSIFFFSNLLSIQRRKTLQVTQVAATVDSTPQKHVWWEKQF